MGQTASRMRWDVSPRQLSLGAFGSPLRSFYHRQFCSTTACDLIWYRYGYPGNCCVLYRAIKPVTTPMTIHLPISDQRAPLLVVVHELIVSSTTLI